MKKILSILAVSFLMMGMVACDVIDEQDYIKNNGGTTPPEQPGEPVEPGETGDFTTSKCVLLEDYTGVRCNNCPAAGEIALNIQKQYGHSVVVLGVHSGFLSAPIGGYPNFKTTEGDAWYSFFGFYSNPIGTIKTGVFLAVDAGKGGFQIGYRIVGGGNIGLYKGENVIKIVSAIHFTGAYNGKMQHQVTCNHDVCPGNLHQLAGVNVDGLRLGINILHGHDGRLLTGKLHQMITVRKQAEAEGNGRAADEKEHQ